MSANDGNLAYDTERQYLGTVYAKGLLGALAATGNGEEVVSELESLVGELLPQVPQLRTLLESPRVPLPVKEEVIDKAFGAGTDALRRFLKVVCAHGRFDCLKIVSSTARQLLREQRGLVEGTVVSAEAIPDADRPALVAALAQMLGREVELKYTVDPGILGGLMVRVGDRVYDASLASQLENIRRTATDRAVQQIRQTLDRFLVDAS
ncbi:MAG: ATP synthase F1 subunit delta [Pirellulaceae bacterium]